MRLEQYALLKSQILDLPRINHTTAGMMNSWSSLVGDVLPAKFLIRSQQRSNSDVIQQLILDQIGYQMTIYSLFWFSLF